MQVASGQHYDIMRNKYDVGSNDRTNDIYKAVSDSITEAS